MTEKVTIELTKEQAEYLSENLEFCIFDQVRNDPDIDNIYWLIDQCKTYEKLAKAAGTWRKEDGGE